jgi:hypothetical protein
MYWVYKVAIIIILIVVGIMLFIFMPKVQVFFDITDPVFEYVAENHKKIYKEVKKQKNNNSVIPIFADNRIKNYNYPITYDIIRVIPNIYNFGIINIKANFEQNKQNGCSPMTDDTLRYFYCIKQSAARKSGIWIDGQIKFFQENDWVCGDVSRENSLFNKHKTDKTIILFIDIKRPDHIRKSKSINTDIIKDEILSACIN